MIPTAEEFLIEFYTSIYNNRPESFKSKLSLKRYLDLCIYGRINGEEDNLSELLVKFTKLHVEACKKEIAEKVKQKTIIGGYGDTQKSNLIIIDKDSILNAYPTLNIK